MDPLIVITLYTIHGLCQHTLCLIQKHHLESAIQSSNGNADTHRTRANDGNLFNPARLHARQLRMAGTDVLSEKKMPQRGSFARHAQLQEQIPLPPERLV